MMNVVSVMEMDFQLNVKMEILYASQVNVMIVILDILQVMARDASGVQQYQPCKHL